jgi:tRNA (Thr-GGU) A37 N-methylase
LSIRHLKVRWYAYSPAAASGIAGTAEVYPEYAAGLKDLPGFSHIILIYYFHLSGDYQLR